MTEAEEATGSDGGADGTTQATDRPATSPISANLNALDDVDCRVALSHCCGATRWVEGMMDLRPFESDAALLAGADRVWFALGPDDWLEAFEHHPRIGERSGAEQSLKAQRASVREQAGMDRAAQAVKAAMIEKNLDYEDRFGYVFLICATGKSGEEMLAALESRLQNEADAELRIAAAELAQITRIRLHKLVAAPAQERSS